MHPEQILKTKEVAVYGISGSILHQETVNLRQTFCAIMQKRIEKEKLNPSQKEELVKFSQLHGLDSNLWCERGSFPNEGEREEGTVRFSKKSLKD